MLRRGSSRCTQSRAQNHGNFPVPARHVVRFRGLVHHLIHGQGEKVAEHNVDDWTQACHRRTDSDPRKACFRDRRIENSFAAKFLDQAR